jgi:hypothetical protein
VSYKIKKAAPKDSKVPALYNVVEDYTEFDAPGNVTVCAMTETEDIGVHARILAESYDVPLESMERLLIEGGIHVYHASGTLVTRGLFQCWIDPEGKEPKQTWLLDVMQYAEAEQLARSYGLSLPEAARRVFLRTLPEPLRARLKEENLGLDYKKLDAKVARAGPIKYIDFRKDWSPHFKRLCIMPDGRLVSTGGLEEFAQLHGIAVEQGRTLLERGGTLEIGGEVLACQVVNGQPAVARFNRAQYAKARALVDARGLHLMDALSEVAFNDPMMMGALKRKERGL